MGSIANKVRVYDLAKELKLENRKVIEDARRMGVDVSVPSNTLPDAVADKIRDGKLAAAGALIGAVMKEMRGQADAGRVRELILERLG